MFQRGDQKFGPLARYTVDGSGVLVETVVREGFQEVLVIVWKIVAFVAVGGHFEEGDGGGVVAKF